MQTKVLGILQNTPENEPFMYLVDTNIPNNTAFFFFKNTLDKMTMVATVVAMVRDSNGGPTMVVQWRYSMAIGNDDDCDLRFWV